MPESLKKNFFSFLGARMKKFVIPITDNLKFLVA